MSSPNRGTNRIPQGASAVNRLQDTVTLSFAIYVVKLSLFFLPPYVSRLQIVQPQSKNGIVSEQLLDVRLRD